MSMFERSLRVELLLVGAALLVWLYLLLSFRGPVTLLESLMTLPKSPPPAGVSSPARLILAGPSSPSPSPSDLLLALLSEVTICPSMNASIYSAESMILDIFAVTLF